MNRWRAGTRARRAAFILTLPSPRDAPVPASPSNFWRGREQHRHSFLVCCACAKGVPACTCGPLAQCSPELEHEPHPSQVAQPVPETPRAQFLA
eukprot:13270727-Alexandrium_andersonii.AAC.1